MTRRRQFSAQRHSNHRLVDEGYFQFDEFGDSYSRVDALQSMRAPSIDIISFNRNDRDAMFFDQLHYNVGKGLVGARQDPA
jgi:hypothetical protein